LGRLERLASRIPALAIVPLSGQPTTKGRASTVMTAAAAHCKHLLRIFRSTDPLTPPGGAAQTHETPWFSPVADWALCAEHADVSCDDRTRTSLPRRSRPRRDPGRTRTPSASRPIAPRRARRCGRPKGVASHAPDPAPPPASRIRQALSGAQARATRRPRSAPLHPHIGPGRAESLRAGANPPPQRRAASREVRSPPALPRGWRRG